MRSKILLTTFTSAFALTALACSQGVQVRTSVAPDASLTGLRTFAVLTAPERAANAPTLSQDDPMLSNSITNQQLQSDLVQGFQSKGYTLSTSNPDFQVAYYAGTKEKLDTTYWNPGPGWRYGYRGFGFRRNRFASAWPFYGGYGYGYPYANMQVQDYTQGTVIVDVIDPQNMELIWRGQGVANVSDDPAKYSKELAASVSAILKKFPQAGA